VLTTLKAAVTHNDARSTIRAVAIFFAFVMLVIGVRLNEAQSRHADAQAAYAQDVQAWGTKLAGCERSRSSNRDNAQGWTAHVQYVSSVTQAASVKEDVKRAARREIARLEVVAARLRDRASVSCRVEYPQPEIPDGVDPLERVIARIEMEQTHREQLAASCERLYTRTCGE
jgi:hypothetical protein